MKEMVGGCCVCSDERGWDENPLVYCDGQGCNVAVHQACYGIVQVPSGPWFCRKCESQERAARVVNNKDIRCELCPCRDGALKKTDQNGWAHVVCALYIPEVRFFNVTTMEPIQTSLIPSERFHKTCFICEENNRGSKASFGACMQCNKQGCKQNFHVTCAQLLGLLCEEAGNMMDNVKYCGYCQYHYSKLKKTSNMKIIPPFRPVPTSHPSDSPSSSPEKGSGLQKSSSNAFEEIKGGSNANSSGSMNPNGEKNHGENEGKGSGSNVSPDMNQACSSKNAKTSKKSHNNSGSKSGASNLPDTKSVIPRISIAPSSLFASSSFMNKHANTVSSNNKEPVAAEECKPEAVKIKSHSKGEDVLDVAPVKIEDSGKQEKGDVKDLKEGFIQKKDFSTLQLKEVVTAALDRPMTNSSGGKFDHSSGSLGGIDSISTRFSSLTDKPPPPDIKPHVTLTPIPMRTSTTRLSASREEAEEREREKSAKSKSPVTSLNFSNTFGQPPKLQNQNASPDMTELTLPKSKGPPDLSAQAELPTPEKSAPPAKRSRVEMEPLEDFEDNSEGVVENWPNRDDDVSYTRSGSRRESFPHHSSQSQNVSPSHSSAGGGRNLSQTQEIWESSSKQNKFPVDLEITEELKPLKRGPGRPPRRTGPGREDDRERERKTPGKGRGGRRGVATSSNSFNRRETRESTANTTTATNSMSNGAFVDDNSFDDQTEGSPIPSAGSGRGGRQSSLGRKSAAGGRSSRQEDPPAPTLAQLRQQASNGDSVGGSLPAHMFGNALNPASSMAQRMVDTLSQEIEAAAVNVPEVISPQSQLVGIPFPGKTAQGGLALPSSSSSTVQNNSNSNSNSNNTAVTVRSAPPSSADNPTSSLNGVVATTGPPPTLEQLLERQWEQGSQFLMEQAQHLDIAQLLSCLNQLKQDNRALEEHVASLSQRKDQLTAVNARLSAPLGSSSTLMSAGAGAGFNPPLKVQNGQGTPPPNLPHGKGSVIHVQTTLPSPQQHEMHIQNRNVGQGQYPHSNESGGSGRGSSELSLAHPTHSPHGHSIHSVHNHGHRTQPYGSFSSHGSSPHPGAVPVVTHLSHHPHPLPRDSR